MSNLETQPGSEHVLREVVRQHLYADESELLKLLIDEAGLDETLRKSICEEAESLVEDVRGSSDPVLLESFLAQYGLSTDEGVALMCLAEALLRVPDNETVDALIHDKITPADWGRHLGQSSSSLVNASTWALMLTGNIIGDEPEGLVGTLRGAVRRLGEPVVRTAVNQAIREMGNQFVVGEDIEEAISNSGKLVDKGFTYSYDMLGEAALTDADAKHYHLAYSRAVAALGSHCTYDTVAENPGISVKLSALYPRYEFLHKEQVMVELVARTRSLAMLAKSANMGFNIDAEEADRLDLSLDVIEAVLSSPGLADWDGFGIVVQAYSKRASFVIDWLHDLAVRLDRRIMIRLVKGAYWDTEIKRAQVGGFDGYPVFTRKSHTDISYLCCAKKLLGMTDRIYPQFATHNAHTVSAVYELAKNITSGNHAVYEFQRLHGMGETLHHQVHNKLGTRCRIYAPVGAHEDLLAYLVRRLLENGANSSFVNQIVDESIPAADIAADPFDHLHLDDQATGKGLPLPDALFAPTRVNSRGFDLSDPLGIQALQSARSQFADQQWLAAPMMPTQAGTDLSEKNRLSIINPASGDTTGFSIHANSEDVDQALENATQGAHSWKNIPVEQRAGCLLRASDLMEEHEAELVELTCREAGKTLVDSIAEIREAVDFLRYYADQAQALFFDEQANKEAGWQPKGVFVCISPWNFPLAIFSGQIAAALATGNTVIAKPAEQTPLIAARAVAIFHQAGIPQDALQLLPGKGSEIGNALVANTSINGVCFTGSTETAIRINRNIAEHGNTCTPLIAETGGINAMIVDSTALPEQAVGDIIESAFQSAGQRCSALRLLCVQDDVYERIVEMLKGAMDMLVVGDPAILETDVGPLIDADAKAHLARYAEELAASNKLLHTAPPSNVSNDVGHYLSPRLFQVDSIAEVDREMFGPLLHIYRFSVKDLPQVVEQINAMGFGLTFGLHTRVDERVQDIVDSVTAGNLYINRNQIGAAVGSQPFGGKGLSGTGPKAGGPHYLLRFLSWESGVADASGELANHDIEAGKQNEETDKPNAAELQQLVEQVEKNSTRHWETENPGQPGRPVSACAGSILVQQPSALQSMLTGLIPRLDSGFSLPGNFSEDLFKLFDTLTLHYHETTDLPGPTGESNRLSMQAAGTFLCLTGDELSDPTGWILPVFSCLGLGNGVILVGPQAARLGTMIAEEANTAGLFVNIETHTGTLDAQLLATMQGIAGLCAASDHPQLSNLRKALASREGEIVPLVCDARDICPLISETTLCIDTTAAGGNTQLLAQSL